MVKIYKRFLVSANQAKSPPMYGVEQHTYRCVVTRLFRPRKQPRKAIPCQAACEALLLEGLRPPTHTIRVKGLSYLNGRARLLHWADKMISGDCRSPPPQAACNRSSSRPFRSRRCSGRRQCAGTSARGVSWERLGASLRVRGFAGATDRALRTLFGRERFSDTNTVGIYKPPTMLCRGPSERACAPTQLEAH